MPVAAFDPAVDFQPDFDPTADFIPDFDPDKDFIPDAEETSDPRSEKRAALLAERKAVEETYTPIKAEPTSLAEFMTAQTTPLISLPKPDAPPEAGVIEKVATGLVRSANTAIESITMPATAELVAASAIPVVGKPLAIATGAGIGAHTMQVGVQQFYDAVKRGDVQGAAEAAGNTFVGALLVGGGAKSLAKGEPPPVVATKLAPVTAEAFKETVGETETFAARPPIPKEGVEHAGKVESAVEVSSGESPRPAAQVAARETTELSETAGTQGSIAPQGDALRAQGETRRQIAVAEGSGETAGAPQIPALPTTAQPSAPKGAVSAPQVITSLENVVKSAGGNSPVRIGRFFQKAYGIFKVMPEVIRIRTANDIPTSAHETGHALQKQLYQSVKSSALKQLPTDVKNELIGLGQALYKNKKPSAGYTSEGFAEFLRIYLATDDAPKLAPKTLQYFEKNILANNPHIVASLTESRRLIDTFRNQGAVVRAQMALDQGPGFRQRAAKIWDDYLGTKATVEELDPLRKLSESYQQTTGKTLPPGEDPFLTASWKRGTAGSTVQTMVERGMVDPTGNIVGPSLKEALAPVRNRKEDFTLYLFGRRAVERWGKGKNPGISLEDAQFLVKQFESPEFQLAADKVYEWQRGVLMYVAEANPTLAPAIAAILKASRDYVPLARVIDPKQATAASLLGSSNPLMRMRGSGRVVKDIFPQILENTARLVAHSNKRMVLDQVLKMAQEEGMGYLIEKVPKDRVPTTFNFEQIRKTLEDMGVDTTAISQDEMITFFHSAHKPKGTDPIVPVKTATGIEWYYVDPEIYNVLNGLDVYRLPKAMDLFLGAPGRVFRLGTTGLRASFSLVTNPSRDIQTFIAQTKSDANPAELASAYFSSLGEVIKSGLGGKESPHVKAFYQLGAQLGQPLGLDISYTKKASGQLFKGKTFQVVTNPLDHLRELFSITEAGPRVAELKLMAEKVGWTPGTPMTMEQAVQMALAAKRVTVDFSAAGSVSKVINQAVPFYNPAIQGTRSFARAFKENPKRAILVGATAFTIPTLINWWKNKDEEWYRDLPWREKYLYYNIGEGNNVWQIPKPFEWGNAFSTVPEALLDTWYEKDPEGLKEALGHVFETTNPVDYPVILKVAKEQWQNRIDFFDRPIVPRGQIDLPPGEQKGEYSSKLATWLGQAFPETISPRRVDAAIRSYFGGAVPDLMDALGLGAHKKERAFERSDIPVFGRMFRRGGTDSANSQALADFYDEHSRYSSKARSKERPLTGPEAAYWAQLRGAHAIIKAATDIARETKELEARQKLYREASQEARRVVAQKPKP